VGAQRGPAGAPVASPPVRSRPTLAAAALALAAVVVLVVAVELSRPTGHRATPAGAGVRATTTTTAPTTTTTVDPGSLPQEQILPSATDPTFRAGVQLLWQAIVDGNPSEAMPFFFPVSAYIQVKAIADPVHDWQTRLVADFDQDVMTDHAALGPDPAVAQFTSVSVPSGAVWVQPGVEYNKGSYYRVYGTALHYSAGGVAHAFAVASMISWRGQWYVVHLAGIR